MRSALAVCVLLGLVGCTPTPDVKVAPASPAPSASAVSPTPTSTAPPPRPRWDEATMFARLKPALVACYEQGRKSVPTMLDGRLILNAAIDAAGKASCAIVTDATGLTQEVQDCMAARFEAERFEGSAASASVRVAVTEGNVALGTRPREAAGIESVETFRMPDAFEVLESLVPDLEACVRGVDRTTNVRSITVGARVGTKGKASCALAMSTPEPLPAVAAACAEDVFRRATFPPPTKGTGLILVPLTLVRR